MTSLEFPAVDPQAAMVSWADGANAAAADWDRCYAEDAQNRTITFLFDPGRWHLAEVGGVEVRGTFNGWTRTAGYDLRPGRRGDGTPYWSLTLPYAAVRLPGNCGQPEYRFVVDGQWQNPPPWLAEGYMFPGNDTNQLLLFAGDKLAQIQANIRQGAIRKRLADFDLATDQGRRDLANVRVVPGTTKLVRCYHPFKFTDKNRNRTEFVRVELVKAFYERYGIRGDICLSEDETGNLATLTADGLTRQEEISAYYRHVLMEAGKVLYVGARNGLGTPTYEACYGHPAGEKMGRWLAEVIDFIAAPENPAPFAIHCRLGTDRTGVFCAILGALCGADARAVLADYERSNRMGILEYRHPRKLQYTLELLLGVEHLDDVPNLGEAIATHLVAHGYTTRAQLARLVAKLR